MPALEAKRWDKALEGPLLEQWKKAHAYAFDANTSKKVFSIDTPPPYVNTPVHMGHAATYTIMDFFARYKRMKGYEVLFPIGLDRNGLPIEMAAEKKFNVRLHEVDREQFLGMCQTVLNDASTASLDTFFRLGHSYTSWEIGGRVGDMYETDSVAYRTLTQDTFIDLWNKGLIYEDARLNNYCPGCRTTLADSEIIRGEKETFLTYVIFTASDSNEKLVIATTRPELLCTAAMVIYHPSDTRYTHLEGKKAKVPLFDLEVPIVAHPAADPTFGTGLVFMSRSAGDTDAIRFLIEMGIEPQSCINEEGLMTNVAGFLSGLKTKDARIRVATELKEKGLLDKQEKITHSVPLCERSKDIIEFITMPEYYVKQTHAKEAMRRIAEGLTFYDESSRKILVDWIQNIKIDWPISRRRYYGTEIPLWYCGSCRTPYVPTKGKYYRPWKEKCPAEACQTCGHASFTGETRVLDTWFDSSNSAAYILGKGRNDPFFQAHLPVTLRPQGKEIIRTWLYYSLLKHYLLHDAPLFQVVWVNYHILDEKGTKMSKSLGNVINPQDILDKYGAEPLRLWIATEGNISRTDLSCSYGRIEASGKTLTKFLNIARFISGLPTLNEGKELQPLDQWILTEMGRVVETCEKGFEDYDYYTPASSLRHFLWETFSSHYVELVKNRAYNENNAFTPAEQNGALYSLHYCLDTLLRAFAPILPLFTAHVYHTLHGEDVHTLPYPTAEHTYDISFSTQELMDLNSLIWKTKKENGLSLKSPIPHARIPARFAALEKDIRTAHAIQELAFGEPFALTLK